MARPRKKIKKAKTNLTLDPKIKADSEALAFGRNKSLSELVDELLNRELSSARGLLDEGHDATKRK